MELDYFSWNLHRWYWKWDRDKTKRFTKNGKKPSDIPIETVKNLRIDVNKENMELLGIRLSDDMMKKVNFIETVK